MGTRAARLASTFAALLAAGSISLLAAQEGGPSGGAEASADLEADLPKAPGAQVALSLTETLGFETETGEPGSVVLREFLRASYGRYSGSADLSSSLGAASGSYSAFFDSVGAHFAYRVFGPESEGSFLDAYLRYRKLFVNAWELRIGGMARGVFGPRPAERGAFGDWAIGYEEIRIAVTGLPLALWGGNPVMRLGGGWRFSPRWAADAAVEYFSDEDAAYFPRTLFDFGASLELEKVSLRCRLVIKYTDFPTPTGYIDGYALRLAATIPLMGAGL